MVRKNSLLVLRANFIESICVSVVDYDTSLRRKSHNSHYFHQDMSFLYSDLMLIFATYRYFMEMQCVD